jgi:hypothetical protein
MMASSAIPDTSNSNRIRARLADFILLVNCGAVRGFRSPEAAPRLKNAGNFSFMLIGISLHAGIDGLPDFVRLPGGYRPYCGFY